MRKNFVRLAVVLGLTAILSVNTFAASAFKDVPENHWAYTGISYMQDQGYMTKTSNGEFLPNNTVSYFDVAHLLAKATGYIDENVNKNMDAQLKEAIRQNFAKQQPKLQAFNGRYTSWEKSANEEIAYLLGTGILKDTDLNKFVIKTATGTEVKSVLLKQDLAAMLVRFVGKEKTAIDAYTTTGCTDEALIKEENRPHVAYLKKHGVANGNSKGEFGANDKMTRAQVATMVHRAIVHKEQTTPTKPEVDEETPNEGTLITSKVNKVIDKDTAKGETYVLLEVDGRTKFYTATKDTEIIDAKGNKGTIDDVKVGMKVKALVGEQNKTDTVFKIILDQEVEEEESTQVEKYKGDIEYIGKNGDLRIDTSKGAVTYVVKDDAEITYGKEDLTYKDLEIGDYVEVKVKNNKIVEIKVLELADEKDEVVEGKFVSYIQKADKWLITINEKGKTKEYQVDEDVEIDRNNDEVELSDLRVGDELTMTLEDDKVIAIEAESEEVEFEGHLKSILIAAVPEITITTKTGDQTVVLTADTEIYDSKSKDDITIRDLVIGSKVEVVAESSEAISVIAKDVPSTVTYKGTISRVGPGARYIEVLVEYDALTGESMIYKTINVPSEVEIIIDGSESYRKKLEEGMEVLIKYNYGETMYPVSIKVLD